jgi:hypothetical protein
MLRAETANRNKGIENNLKMAINFNFFYRRRKKIIFVCSHAKIPLFQPNLWQKLSILTLKTIINGKQRINSDPRPVFNNISWPPGVNSVP